MTQLIALANALTLLVMAVAFLVGRGLSPPAP
jgi:hypothetical protein